MRSQGKKAIKNINLWNILKSFNLYWEGYPVELAPFLKNQFLVVEDKIFAQYYPGFPLLLAIGMQLGCMTLVNPFLAGIGILLTYYLANEVSDSASTSFLSALLLAMSPSYLYNSATLFSHTASLVLGILFLLTIIKAARTLRVSFSIISALAWGMLLFTRPLSAAVFGFIGALGRPVKR